MSKTIYIASDHGGFAVKEAIGQYLREYHYSYQDLGTDNQQIAVDYPDFAGAVARAVLADPQSSGILVCGTGIGMSIVANRYQGIRAALCHNEYTAQLAREHNDANVLVLGGRILEPIQAVALLPIWLSTPYQGGRHQRRLQKIESGTESH